jgi:gas vesicle protein
MGRDSYDNGARSDGRGSWMCGLILGVLGGTAVALLTAPKTGREMRGAIKDTAQNMPTKVNEIVDESLDVYASALNYMQLVIEEQTLRLKRAVAAGKLAAAKKREELEMGGSSVLPFQHR